MKFKLCFILTLSLIVLFSLGAVASENATDIESDVLNAPSDDDAQITEDEVLGDSEPDPFEYNQITYDFGGVKYESNALISDDGSYIGRGLLPGTVFAWTLTINTTSEEFNLDSRLPYSHFVVIQGDGEEIEGYNPYNLIISGLKLPDGLEYMNHYVDSGTYDVEKGTWIIKNVPKDAQMSLSVLSRVTAQAGEYIPGFYAEYQKVYTSNNSLITSETWQFHIWENKLVLSNQTEEINYTEEISQYIPREYLPNEPFEIIPYNESYDGVSRVSGDTSNLYMIIDENGDITKYAFYIYRSTIGLYESDWSFIFTCSWSYVITESGKSWRTNRDYRYPAGAYSSFRVVSSSSQDNGKQPKEESKTDSKSDYKRETDGGFQAQLKDDSSVAPDSFKSNMKTFNAGQIMQILESLAQHLIWIMNILLAILNNIASA